MSNSASLDTPTIFLVTIISPYINQAAFIVVRSMATTRKNVSTWHAKLF